MRATQALLWPLTPAYGAAVLLHAWAYRTGILKQRRLPAIVISVGNLTVGGTAKTPMVLWLAEHLLSQGKRVGILTRGYRGKSVAPATEGTRNTPVRINSDEALLLKSRLGNRSELGVGADRFAHGREMIQRGIEWFILDDGFQHRRLARDQDIVLIDATNPFGGGRLLPVGTLREPRSALARADIIVITRSRHAPAVESVVRHETKAPIFYASPRLDSVLLNRFEDSGDVAARGRTKKLFAFCGIGNPSAFLADLRAWNFKVAGNQFFPDHHRYSESDIQLVEGQVQSSGAEGAICTEKDIFNLPEGRPFSIDLYYCRISLDIENESGFWRTILNQIEGKRAKTGLPPSTRL